MSSKEMKTLFKEIREAIKSEKYQDAIKKCEVSNALASCAVN